MNQTNLPAATRRRRPARRWCAGLSLGLLLLVACQTVQVFPVGTLAGHVTIGPLQPVSRAGEPEPTPEPAVYAARQIVIYDADGQTEVTRVAIDNQGNYQVDLPVGTYIVDINHAGLDRADSLPATVTITVGETTRLDVTIDTGLR